MILKVIYGGSTRLHNANVQFFTIFQRLQTVKCHCRLEPWATLMLKRERLICFIMFLNYDLNIIIALGFVTTIFSNLVL